MNRGLSIWFDLVRALAGLEVFLFHMSAFDIGVPRAWWNSYGHEAVVLFFVLSGYVITFAAQTRDRDFGTYLVSRITRVFSVALPALALTLVFDLIGSRVAPVLYANFPQDLIGIRLLSGLLMLNESYIPVQMLSNTPYWSIAYEFWYYFLFGAIFYFTGRTRWLLVALFAIAAGPRILILFPLWLMGSWAYRSKLGAAWPEPLAWLVLLIPAPVLYAYGEFGFAKLTATFLADLLGQDLFRNGLSWSRYVLSDTVLAIVVTLHFLGARRLAPRLEAALGAAERPIRLIAAFSFTLYLIHQPTLLFLASILGGPKDSTLLAVGVTLGTLTIVAAVGYVTENQRYRLKPIVSSVYGAVARMIGATFLALGRSA